MIKQINQHIGKKYSISKPVFLTIPKNQDFGKMKDKFFTKDELFLFLYVDDGALPFLSRSDALLGSEITLREMSRLGLTMHVGKGEKASKTEAVSFPSRTKI